MPGAEHETLAELVSLDPVRVATLLSVCAGVKVPTFDVVRMADSDLSNRNPTQHHADNVLLLEGADKTRYAIVVEVQRARDDDKAYAWLVYLAMTRSRHQCPAMVVVIATNKTAETFASTPIDTGHPGYPFTPVVLGPDNIPRIHDPAEAAADPCTATIGVIVHQDETDQLHAYAETVNHLDEALARKYAGLALQAFTENPRKILERIMTDERYDYWGNLASEKIQEGRHEGTVQALLTFLSSRGLSVPAAARARIQRCTDSDQLATWIQRAATVNKAEDLFA